MTLLFLRSSFFALTLFLPPSFLPSLPTCMYRLTISHTAASTPCGCPASAPPSLPPSHPPPSVSMT